MVHASPMRALVPARSCVQMGLSRNMASHAAALALSSLLAVSSVAPMHQVLADGGTEKFKFPPIDNSKKGRCTFTSSAMGQANAARDSLYDLRECKMAGSDASTFDISGALMEKGDFSNSNFRETQLSKVYAPNTKFDGADFTNGVVDRAYFNGASFKARGFKPDPLGAATPFWSGFRGAQARP